MSKTKSFFIFLTGLAAGGTAGILFAPRRGGKTRKKIAKRIKQFSSGVAGKAEGIAHQLKNDYETMKENMSQ